MFIKFKFVRSLGINMVGANCVRPRAVTDRPYKSYRTVFVKFKFYELLANILSYKRILRNKDPADKKPEGQMTFR